MNGVELIAIERKRQIEELGYDYTHDALYANNQLGEAGAAYATKDPDREDFWPWDDIYWKPTPEDRIKELSKAGALIAAQIDYEISKNK